jgi:hypothetical protein
MGGFAKVSQSAVHIDLGYGITERCAYAHALELGQDHSAMSTPVTVNVTIGTMYSGMKPNGLVT